MNESQTCTSLLAAELERREERLATQRVWLNALEDEVQEEWVFHRGLLA